MIKLKLSIAEKKSISFFVMCALIEIIIILLVSNAIASFCPLQIQDTKQIEIVVEDVFYDYGRVSSRLVLTSGSEKYYIHNRSSEEEYSIRQLKEMITIGDRLILNYCEERNLWGKYNSVVNAQTETEVFRSIDNFNNDQKIGSIILIIVLIFIELFLCLYVILYTFLNKNTIRSLLRKITRRTGDGSLC